MKCLPLQRNPATANTFFLGHMAFVITGVFFILPTFYLKIFFTHVLLIFYLCVTCILPVSYIYITFILPMCYLYFTYVLHIFHLCFTYILPIFVLAVCVYVDTGIPYNDGPLKVAELVVDISIDQSPKHVKGKCTAEEVDVIKY